MSKKISLLDAIRVVKENERLASNSYAEAALVINNPDGKKIFEELSAFEQYHYDQLSAFEASLEKTGEYREYQGREFPTPPVFEIVAAKEPNMKSVIKIIEEAIELEKEAETVYADLAVRSDNSQGYKMFRRLSSEEHIHWRILLDAYWKLTNLGTWTWSQP
jgi:rubrerythrin